MKGCGLTVQKNPLYQIFCMSPLAVKFFRNYEICRSSTETGTFCSYQRSLLYLQVVANQEGIEMSGYLRFKKGRHGWKKSWFALKNNVLYSYKASSVGNMVYDYNFSLICQYSRLFSFLAPRGLRRFVEDPLLYVPWGN